MLIQITFELKIILIKTKNLVRRVTLFYSFGTSLMTGVEERDSWILTSASAFSLSCSP